jgi:hypothetical protein
MTDLIEQLQNYGQHFDRAIGHNEPSARSNDHPIQSEPDEGDLIVVDIQTVPPETEPLTDQPGRKWLPYALDTATGFVEARDAWDGAFAGG